MISLSIVASSPTMMRDSFRKRELAVFLTLALAAASVTQVVAAKSQQAVAQSPMDMMEMMMGGGNMSDGTAMTLGDNMSMPFNMGVLVMPTICTTPGQLLGSLTGMFNDEMTSDGNVTRQMMTEMMGQQMMTSGGGMGTQNMSGREMQQAMNLQICFPMMSEEMTQHMQQMMGNGQNSTGGMMNGMMMQ